MINISTQMRRKLAKISQSNFPRKSHSQIDDAIRNRESWIKGFVIVFPVVIIGWKILRTPLNIVGPVTASDVLFGGLALFAISLSAIFYLRATAAVNHSYEQLMLIMKDLLVTAPSNRVSREVQDPRPTGGMRTGRMQQPTEPDIEQAETATKTPPVEQPDNMLFRMGESDNMLLRNVEADTLERFYEILFTQVAFSDVMNYNPAALDQKFGDSAKSLPTNDLEFLLEYGYITNDWMLSAAAHSLIIELKDKFRMKAIV